MKKLTSLFLVVICCLTMSIPAFATDTEPSVKVLTYSELKELQKNGNGIVPDGCIALGEEESASFWDSFSSDEDEVVDLDLETVASTYDARPTASATSITAWPLGLNMETGELF